VFEAWNGAVLSNRLGLQKVITEGDALKVVNAFNSDGMWMGSYRAVI
jgi:hypothetical protein